MLSVYNLVVCGGGEEKQRIFGLSATVDQHKLLSAPSHHKQAGVGHRGPGLVILSSGRVLTEF